MSFHGSLISGSPITGSPFTGATITQPPLDSFTPSLLFASNETGVWYDPSDLTTLFTDTAGTTPVTAAGQSVALMLDKSGRGNHAVQATASARPIYRVDANGRSYLEFDGTDDSMATSAINFTGTNKMTVFAGVRKLSDAAVGVIVENGTGANTGRVVLYNQTAAGWGFNSAGTLEAGAQIASGYVAPITNVITGIGDISGDSIVLRINGAQIATSSADQGTGNYANAALYIGRRASTSLPFNGNLYGLIVRGAQSTDSQITNTETWLNSKTGAY